MSADVHEAATAATTRRTVLRRVLVTGGAVTVAGALLGRLPEPASPAPSAAQDKRVFEYLLGLEQLQAAFYGETVDRGKIGGDLARFARTVAGHEREHVRYLTARLGRPRPVQRYDFGDATVDPESFVDLAIALEDTGVGAYNGQAANLTPAGLAAAARVVSVDARHAAWVRALVGRNPAIEPVDPGLSQAQVQARLKRAGVA
jgi:hypothetical protein